MPQLKPNTSEFVGWNVYKNPTDYPGKYVVRRWKIGGDGLRGVVIYDAKPCYVGDTLEEARASIPEGCTMLPRDGRDDPCIHEVWVYG